MSSGFSSNYDNAIENIAFNDIFLDKSGNIATSTGDTLTIENAYHALWLLYGEYFYDTTIGLDYEGYLSSNNTFIGEFKLAVQETLLDVNGISSINYIDTSINSASRLLETNVNITLASGNTADINFIRNT